MTLSERLFGWISRSPDNQVRYFVRHSGGRLVHTIALSTKADAAKVCLLIDELADVLDARQAPAEPPTTERELRKVLWINHGCPVTALYGDDGEMQCSACRLDFKMMPLADLCMKLIGMGRLHAGKLPDPPADAQAVIAGLEDLRDEIDRALDGRREGPRIASVRRYDVETLESVLSLLRRKRETED